MTTVTSLTAERMLDIEAASVVDGNIVGDNLILTKHDGSTIDAGVVKGDPGPTGPAPSNVAYGILGYAQTTVGQSGVNTVVDVVTCTVTVTVASGRRIKITGQGGVYASVSNDHFIGRIKEGVSELGLWFSATLPVILRKLNQSGVAIVSPSAGVHTYKLTIERSIGSGTGTVLASASEPAFILVEDIGPV